MATLTPVPAAVLAAALALVGLVGCSPRPTRPAVLLVSLDGLRWDAVNTMPDLAARAAEGVHAAHLVPPFPSKTYPSHVSLSTGLHPDRHGIVSNDFWDPELGEEFSYGDADDLSDPAWFLGEPIWVTAERQGLPTAVMWFPGHQAPFDGVLPTVAAGIDHGWSHDTRIDMAVDWLRGRGGEAPARLATLYFSDADDQGHWNGPGSPELADAHARLDASLTALVERLEDERMDELVTVVVVSDHGMTTQARDRVVFLDDLIDLDAVTIPSMNPVAHIWPGRPPEADPSDDAVAGLLASLDSAPGMTCWEKAALPAAWRHQDSPRVAPITCVADVGHALGTRSAWESSDSAYTGGMHGHDPAEADMHGLLVGWGPGLSQGVHVDQLHHVDVYSLLAGLLDLEPAATDGSAEAVAPLLR